MVLNRKVDPNVTPGQKKATGCLPVWILSILRKEFRGSGLINQWLSEKL